MFGLSPLSTSHHSLFQQTSVRSSTWCYPSFNLDMDSSLGFGSIARYLNALFILGFPSATRLNLLTLQHTITRRLIMQKARSQASRALLRLVGYRFQVLFHSPPGVLFTFPSRYLFTIGYCRVFSLGWWSTRIPTGLLVSDRTQDTPKVQFNVDYGTITHSGRAFQHILLSHHNPTSGSYNPRE